MFEQMLTGIQRSIDTLKRPSFQINSFSSGESLKSDRSLELTSGDFEEFYLNKKGDAILAISKCGKAFCKISLKKNSRKLNTLKEESSIIKTLNEKGAVTCPKFLEDGEINEEKLNSILHLSGIQGGEASKEYYYFVQEYIPSAKKAFLADVIFAILEQKSLGVFHGDVKPENIRFNENNGVCYLIDYDQAMLLSSEQMQLSNDRFFRWIDERQKEMYGFESWLRHFKGISNVDMFFKNGSFNLVNTTVYWNQRTTNTKNGVYHTIQTAEVFAEGVRDLKDRKSILDKMTFVEGERTLDIGCNVGLLSFYLGERGCAATGYELDPSIIWAAKILNNIWKKSVKFECFDLDSGSLAPNFDTVMLFSVFHHTKDLKGNGLKIASACKRIVIECRLFEQGRKPKLIGWEETSNWNYSNLDELYLGLETYFPGFKFIANHGSADKGRFIIELRKS